MKVPARTGLAAICIAAFGLAVQSGDEREPVVLTERLHHLGDDEVDDWEGVPHAPEGLRLDLDFTSRRSSRELSLEIQHVNVHSRWAIELNQREIATIDQIVESKTRHYAVPPNSLVDGSNRLSIVLLDVPEDNKDDIGVGNIVLHGKSYRELKNLRSLTVHVRDSRDNSPVPARLTIVDLNGDFIEVHFGESDWTAIRPGVAYTASGDLCFEVPAGEYDVYASRGTEWSRAKTRVSLASATEITLELTREVDTTGYVAADTHIHTLQFSGHGDASALERIVTLAAEGIELPISTDHNHQTDYRPFQTRLEMNDWFTPVVGNEVTTNNGHFNAFPLDPKGPIPKHRIPKWPALMDNIRETGAQVVIWNHPRWPGDGSCPLARFSFVPESGEHDGPAFTFDALELVNSTTEEPEPYRLLFDWFGILNAGERVFAVGSSDSHTVADPVGQGRTYVASSTDVATEIDIEEACEAFRTGHMSVSLGIITDVRVRQSNRVAGMGETLALDESALRVELRVAAPGYVTLREARAYLNGIEVAQFELESDPGTAQDEWITFELEAPQHDGYLVCALRGDDVDEPFWHSLNPYTFAATNPVFLDADRSGTCSLPREIARARLEEAREQPDEVARALDDATLIQLLVLAREAYSLREFADLIDAASSRDGIVRTYLDRR